MEDLPDQYTPKVLRDISSTTRGREVCYAVCAAGAGMGGIEGPFLDIQDCLEYVPTVEEADVSPAIVRYEANGDTTILYDWAGKSWIRRRQ